MKNCKIVLFVLVLLNVFVSFGQEKIITGIVTDDAGIPIPGTSILLKGTKTSISAGLNGEYSIKAKTGEKLIYNFIGKKSKSVIVHSNLINVILEDENPSKLKRVEVWAGTCSKKRVRLVEQKEITITGTMTDCEGNPLSGASILVMGTKNATTTNFNGKYSITAHENEILVYTFIGMESEKVYVKEQTKIDIKLKESKNKFEDIVIIAKKPVIYLYPTAKIDITVQLDFKGKLLTTFPEYKDKWDVTVYPDGRIFDKKTNRFYASLFWDGSQVFPQEHYNYKDGFVVVKKDLTSFLIQKLEFMGLNNNETNEFVQYWLPILEKNETNCIHFWVNTDYNTISRNIIAPKPETELRIFMEFYAVDKTFKIPEQNLRRTERKGFTLVEWGGSDVSNAMNSIKLKI
jgi:hypothetical protein